MSVIRVAPAPGRTVLDPERGYKPLPEEGAKVPRNQFWMRRLADGDVIVKKKPAAPKRAAPKPDKQETK